MILRSWDRQRIPSREEDDQAIVGVGAWTKMQIVDRLVSFVVDLVSRTIALFGTMWDLRCGFC